jgi:hypothetical protein
VNIATETNRPPPEELLPLHPILAYPIVFPNLGIFLRVLSEAHFLVIAKQMCRGRSNRLTRAVGFDGKAAVSVEELGALCPVCDVWVRVRTNTLLLTWFIINIFCFVTEYI